MGIAVNRCKTCDRVIIWTIGQTYTLAEYRHAFAESQQIANQIPKSFDIIVDTTQCNTLAPDTFFELGATGAATSLHLRSVAIVGANLMVRTILSAFSQSDSRLGAKIYFAETLSQARKLVCRDLKRSTGAFSTQETRPVGLLS